MYDHAGNRMDDDHYQYQMEQIRQKVKVDVAWKIFEEINQINDQLKHIDLGCLDYEDAMAITKQKIYDLARHIAVRNPKNARNHVCYNFILNIKCADDHMILMENEYGNEVLRNGIVEMIKNELGLDYYYVVMTRTILVRVDDETIEIPLFGGL